MSTARVERAKEDPAVLAGRFLLAALWQTWQLIPMLLSNRGGGWE